MVKELRLYVSVKYPRSSTWRGVRIKMTSGMSSAVKSRDMSQVLVKCPDGTEPKVPMYSMVGNIIGKAVYQGGLR